MQRSDINDLLRAQFEKLRRAERESGLAIEGMRVLVKIESDKRVARGEPPLMCPVILANDLDIYLAEMKKTKPLPGEDLRSQFIVCNGMHYTAFDVKLSEQGNECIILDAAQDPRRVMAASKILNMQDEDGKDFFKAIYSPSAPKDKPRENLQDDFFSCIMFAFDHVCRVSELSDIYKLLAQRAEPRAMKGYDNYPIVTWEMLPPSLVWNAQSYVWLLQYAEKHPDTVNAKIPSLNMSFMDYIERAQQLGAVIADQPAHVTNPSTYFMFEKLAEEALHYLQKNAVNVDEKVIRPTVSDEVSRLIMLQEKLGHANKLMNLSEAMNDANQLLEKVLPANIDARLPAMTMLVSIQDGTQRENVELLKNYLIVLRKVDSLLEVYQSHVNYHSKDPTKLQFSRDITLHIEKLYLELSEKGREINPDEFDQKIKSAMNDIARVATDANEYHRSKHSMMHKFGLLGASRVGVNNGVTPTSDETPRAKK